MTFLVKFREKMPPHYKTWNTVEISPTKKSKKIITIKASISVLGTETIVHARIVGALVLVAFASLSSISRRTLTLVATDQLWAVAINTRIRTAIIDESLTVWSTVTHVAIARISVNSLDTLAIRWARIAQAVVDLDLARGSRVARRTLTSP